MIVSAPRPIKYGNPWRLIRSQNLTPAFLALGWLSVQQILEDFEGTSLAIVYVYDNKVFLSWCHVNKLWDYTFINNMKTEKELNRFY